MKLERKVMTSESSQAIAMLRKGLFGQLADSLLDYITGFYCPSYTFFPVEYESWFNLSDDDFRETAESYFTSIADNMVHQMDRHISTPPWELITSSSSHVNAYQSNTDIAERSMEFCAQWRVYLSLKRNFEKANTSREKLESIFKSLSTSVPRKIEMYFSNTESIEWCDIFSTGSGFVIDDAKYFAENKLPNDKKGKPVFTHFSVEEHAFCKGRITIGMFSEVLNRDYPRFALLSEEMRQIRALGDMIYSRSLPCMIGGFPADCHPAWNIGGGYHSFCHCYIGDLLSTDWDVLASPYKSRRGIMGDDAILEFNQLKNCIGADTLNKYRLVISFDN